jgi:CheY-like chemotaxis protein
MMKTLLR